jgi:bacterioferritin-associated ferredoxin
LITHHFTQLTIVIIKINLNTPEQLSEPNHMYVCLCKGVTDGQIRDAIYEGCCSFRDVRESLGVATQCGKCACLAKQVVSSTLGDLHNAQAALAYPANMPG